MTANHGHTHMGKLCLEAERHVGGDCVLEDLFTEDELNSNSDAIRKLNAEYSAIHHLDGIDISISAVAALTGAAIDLLLVGIPQKGPDGLTAGSLSNYVRAYFEKSSLPKRWKSWRTPKKVRFLSMLKTTVTPQNMCKDCLHIIIACSLSVMIRCLALW